MLDFAELALGKSEIPAAGRELDFLAQRRQVNGAHVGAARFERVHRTRRQFQIAGLRAVLQVGDEFLRAIDVQPGHLRDQILALAALKGADVVQRAAVEPDIVGQGRRGLIGDGAWRCGC